MRDRVVYFNVDVIDVVALEQKMLRADREFLWCVIVPDVAMFAVFTAVCLFTIL